MTNSEDKLNILVVDDENLITMHLDEVLSNFGYNVVGRASSGSEAIEKAQKLQPDIILMDIIMPGELSGIDAANIIKKRFGIPIIFLSAFGDDSLVEKTKISEPLGYIMKPFKNQELKAAIELAKYKIEIDKKLRESEEKYRTVAEQSRDGIGIVQDGRFRYVNPILYELLGKPPNIYDSSYKKYFANISKVHLNNIIDCIIQEKACQPIVEFDLVCGKDTYIPIEANCSKITYDGRDAALFFFRNIAKRKYFERLLEIQINEINENNQIIISNIEQYMTKVGDIKLQKQFKKILSNLFQNANSLKKMYKLLQLEQDDSSFYPIDVMETINNAIDNVIHQFPHKNINIKTNINGIIPKIHGDDLFLEVFQSLFETSINNTDDNNVSISAMIRPHASDGKRFVEIIFEDNSNGIIINDDHNLFGRMIMSNYSYNSKIDLAFVKIVLNRYLGEIEIENRTSSENSNGCVYNIKVPAI